jgi:hypothetical protein
MCVDFLKRHAKQKKIRSIILSKNYTSVLKTETYVKIMTLFRKRSKERLYFLPTCACKMWETLQVHVTVILATKFFFPNNFPVSLTCFFFNYLGKEYIYFWSMCYYCEWFSFRVKLINISVNQHIYAWIATTSWSFHGKSTVKMWLLNRTTRMTNVMSHHMHHGFNCWKKENAHYLSELWKIYTRVSWIKKKIYIIKELWYEYKKIYTQIWRILYMYDDNYYNLDGGNFLLFFTQVILPSWVSCLPLQL